jgi:asparaginyl-tRNA synthetase
MPHLSGPFYQAFADERRQSALSADLLMGIGETVGAGQRHESGQDLDEALTLHRVSREPYQWYIELRRQRSIQTSGFGLGTERYLCWLLNHDDVRDLQLVPRFNGLKHLF